MVCTARLLPRDTWGRSIRGSERIGDPYHKSDGLSTPEIAGRGEGGAKEEGEGEGRKKGLSGGLNLRIPAPTFKFYQGEKGGFCGEES